MKMRMNPAIARMSAALDCDYLFALGLYMVLDEMKGEKLDSLSDERFLHELGYMSTKMSRILSTKKGGQIWDIYGDTKVDIKRDMERDKKRDYRERKRNAPSSPFPPTPPIPPISPKEKERGDTPPLSLRESTPGGGTPTSKPCNRFVPPTVDEVRAYAKEKGYGEKEFSAEHFVDFYGSKGWKVGKNTMKDWQAAARGWVSRYRQEHPESKPRNYDVADEDWFF